MIPNYVNRLKVGVRARELLEMRGEPAGGSRRRIKKGSSSSDLYFKLILRRGGRTGGGRATISSRITILSSCLGTRIWTANRSRMLVAGMPPLHLRWIRGLNSQLLFLRVSVAHLIWTTNKKRAWLSLTQSLAWRKTIWWCRKEVEQRLKWPRQVLTSAMLAQNPEIWKVKCEQLITSLRLSHQAMGSWQPWL